MWAPYPLSYIHSAEDIFIVCVHFLVFFFHSVHKNVNYRRQDCPFLPPVPNAQSNPQSRVSLKLVAISVHVYLSIVMCVATWATVKKVRGPSVELVF